MLIWPAEGQHQSQSLSQPRVSLYFYAYCEAIKKNTFFVKKKGRILQINNIKNKLVNCKEYCNCNARGNNLLMVRMFGSELFGLLPE